MGFSSILNKITVAFTEMCQYTKRSTLMKGKNKNSHTFLGTLKYILKGQ